MELTALVKQYVKKRDDFVLRIAKISQQLTTWTDEHSKEPPTLTDIAHFEGLRAERARLLSEFTEAEDDFVVQLLNEVGRAMR